MIEEPIDTTCDCGGQMYLELDYPNEDYVCSECGALCHEDEMNWQGPLQCDHSGHPTEPPYCVAAAMSDDKGNTLTASSCPDCGEPICRINDGPWVTAGTEVWPAEASSEKRG